MVKSTVFIALGGNIGSVLAHFRYARSALGAMNDCVLTKSSSLYQTLALGVKGQDDYLNAMIAVDTPCPQHALLGRLHGIEDACGRTRSTRWAARTLDLDIIDYASKIEVTETLTLPHPQAHRRAFVLLPLADIMPAWQHPVLKENIQQLLLSCDCQGIQRLSDIW
ncbi:MAG: 2-amino-4-hydroxy-6-hydroxymethyldihydropteridine diphosphokinase [Mariprofundaceae bacterium]|nr:2-amino-4-hydroxy-6-hydroxymethyldihydropteridine diphosphokinase [Mariprofundaceae bacterium]